MWPILTGATHYKMGLAIRYRLTGILQHAGHSRGTDTLSTILSRNENQNRTQALLLVLEMDITNWNRTISNISEIVFDRDRPSTHFWSYDAWSTYLIPNWARVRLLCSLNAINALIWARLTWQKATFPRADWGQDRLL